MSTTTTIPSSSHHKQWIENRILYNEYNGEITLADALKMSKESLQLLDENHIRHTPAIVIFHDKDQTKLSFKLSDFGKLIGSNNIFKKISGMWVVGASPDIKNVLDFVNNSFFSGHIHLVENLAEAKAAATKALATEDSILEK